MMVAASHNDSNCAVSWRSRPASFVSLMSLYESNYIRLGWLIPGLSTFPPTAVSAVPGDCPLHLRLDERSRYTTTLTLTYLFDEGGTQVSDPDLQIRIYHDARLAEVQACARWHRHAMLESLRSELVRSLGERWLRNMMLNKWLDYCVERGHCFHTTSQPAASATPESATPESAAEQPGERPDPLPNDPRLDHR